MTQASYSEQAAPSRWHRLASFGRPYRGAVVGILALTLIMSTMGALEPLLFGYVFDAISSEGVGRPLAVGVVAFAALSIARELVSAVHNWLTWRTRIGVNQDLLHATVDKLHTLPLSFHQQESVGGRMMLVDRGIQGLVAALTEIAFDVIPAVTYLAISVAIMLKLDWRLALVVMLFAPLPAVVGMWAAPEQIRRERWLFDRWAKIYGRFNEVLHGILTVKSFAMEDAEKARFLGDVSEANAVVVRGVGRDAISGAMKNLIAAAARIAALGFGAWLAWNGETTAGTVLAFMGYLGGLFGPVQGLTNVYQTIRKASVSLDTVFGIFDAEDTLGDAPDAVRLPRVRGEVVFEGVRFAYDPRRPVLDGIDLRAAPGETIALVGPSGSGKSTAMALLQRLYDPTHGSIRIDGQDLRAVQQRSLRQQIGVVLQDGVLFDDTVRANIAYGRPNASQQEIEAAARAAHAHDFIVGLADGYDTVLGERAKMLSAGQRQRVAIARALLKDPPILILDEATSALDAESEHLVQRALEQLMQGRTTFVIAHRLTTVVNADRICVLRGGRIAEEGTHVELLARAGYYAQLVHQQMGGLTRWARRQHG